MASIVEQLAGELGVSSELVRAALGGGEVQALRSKRAVVQREWSERTAEHEAQIGELDTLIAEAQRKLDEAAGKG